MTDYERIANEQLECPHCHSRACAHGDEMCNERETVEAVGAK